MRLRTTISCLILLTAALSSCSSTTTPPVSNDALFDSVEVCPEGVEAQPPRAIRRVDPRDPEGFGARMRHAEATVEAIIGADGSVLAARHQSGDRAWGNSVAAAVMGWKFEPATCGGQPTPIRFVLTSRYRAGERPLW